MGFIEVVFTIVAAAIALAVQQRADLPLTNRGFDDTHKRTDESNRRIDALESQRREDSAAFSSQLAAVGRDVAELVCWLERVAEMASPAFLAGFGVMLTRRDRKDRGPSVIEQAPLTASGSGQDSYAPSESFDGSEACVS